MPRAITVMAFVVLGACGPMAATGGPLDQVFQKEAQSSITNLRFHATRASAGLISPLFSENTSSVVCSFNVRGLRTGTRIAVRWEKSGRVLATNDLVTSHDTRTMSADLTSDAPLGSGTYDVSVLVGGRVEASGHFRIAGEPEPEQPTNQGPRVFALTLVAGNDECVPEASSRPSSVTTFTGGVNAVHVCLQYENIGSGQELEVRWFRSTSPRQPLSVTSYSPTGAGELSASYAHDDGIQPGSYHVTVTLDGREVGRKRFAVR